MVSGLLFGDKTHEIKYGSADMGEEVEADPEFHELMLSVGLLLLGKHYLDYAAANQLQIKPHKIIRKKDGKRVQLAGPLECKGIVGTDGRKYILDLTRMTPRDPNYLGTENTYVVFRPELIILYTEYLRAHHQAKMKGMKEEEVKEFKTPAFNPNLFTPFKIDE